MSLPSSSWRRNSFPPLLADDKSKVEESDEDLFTVPDVEQIQPASDDTTRVSEVQQGSSNNTSGKQRRRGRNPVDREYRKLKRYMSYMEKENLIFDEYYKGNARLLRNRVSAQQARERKKVYVNDLESKAERLQDKNSKLEEKISTLVNENTMLRKILMSTRPKADESVEPKPDQSANS
ncbi:hypothetical protein IFM89_002841 [Coptis chinensis]|uniref:BZIP domain-containing protein n=1 Tax=Coptis chinensis TaxID=261450 RepID=A0A835H252_9MAGN|nr:hypothetical protein IFM89_002841 [Coptis chinensis]